MSAMSPKCAATYGPFRCRKPTGHVGQHEHYNCERVEWWRWADGAPATRTTPHDNYAASTTSARAQPAAPRAAELRKATSESGVNR